MALRRSRRPFGATPAARATALALVVVVAAAAGCGGEAGAGAGGSAGAGGQAKLTVAGDSISVGLGASLRSAVAGDDGPDDVEVKVIGEGGTGLARPDRFDWPARLERLAAEFPPTVLVFSVGSNDAQDLTDASGDTVATLADAEAWDAEYSARLARVFDAFEGTGTSVVWVGHVRTEEQRVADGNRRIDDLARAAAAGRGWVQVEDLAELTGSGAEEVSDCLIGDGLHLTVDCYDDAAEALAPRLPLG
jgi:lysophospholipase L1-like esterase